MQNFAKPARNQIRKVAQEGEEKQREKRERRTHSGVCCGFNQQKDKRHKVFSVFFILFCGCHLFLAPELQMKMSDFAVQSKKKESAFRCC